jgi:proline dehydrogenase
VALLDHAIVRLLPAVPRSIVRRLSGRYIAGSTLEDAVRVVRSLNVERKLATIDVLGEEIRTPGEATAIVDAYRAVFTEIERCDLDSNVSVKLSALGLELGYALCRDNLEDVVAHAAERNNFVRIDMEDSSTTDDTLALYRELRRSGRANVGVVLQASLRRTLQDVRDLADLRPSVRLCKGIYLEPPSVQFQGYEQVRTSFLQALDALLEAGAYVAVATHDQWLIDRTLERVRGLGPDAYEFQLLLGVRPALGDRLVAAGHRLRVYVPFGTHWYEYSLRRLQENPAIARHVTLGLLGRGMR